MRLIEVVEDLLVALPDEGDVTSPGNGVRVPRHDTGNVKNNVSSRDTSKCSPPTIEHVQSAVDCTPICPAAPTVTVDVHERQTATSQTAMPVGGTPMTMHDGK